MERWKVNLYTVWFSQILSLMSFGFGMPFIPFFIQELGVTDPSQLKIYSGILNAAPAVTMAVMAPIWGIIADKYGKKLMLLRAMFFATFIIGGMGLVTHVDQLVVLRFIQGIFTGTVTAATVLVAANTPKHRLSYALGFLSSSAFIGQSIGPVVGGFVAEFVGYRTSFYIGAVLMFIDFLLVLFIVKENRETAQEAEVPGEKAERKPRASLFSIFTVLTVAMLTILLFVRIGRSAFNPYMPLYVQEIRGTIEGTTGITGLINGVLSLAAALSGLTLSRLGDKYDRITLMGVLLLIGAVLSIPLLWVHNLWVFAALYGLLCYVTGGVEPIIMSVTTEHTSPERRGALFGMQGLVGSVGFALAPVLGSAISIRFSLQAVFLLIPVFLLLSVAAAALLKGKGGRGIKDPKTVLPG